MSILIKLDCVFRKIKDDRGKKKCHWFNNINRTLTKGKLGYITPLNISHGILQAANIGGDSASYWQSSLNNRTIVSRLHEELSKIYPNEEINNPHIIHAVIWDCGYHLWKSGFDTEEYRQLMKKPMENVNLHICGEVVAKVQGYMESSLDSATELLDFLKMEMPDLKPKT